MAALSVELDKIRSTPRAEAHTGLPRQGDVCNVRKLVFGDLRHLVVFNRSKLYRKSALAPIINNQHREATFSGIPIARLKASTAPLTR